RLGPEQLFIPYAATNRIRPGAHPCRTGTGAATACGSVSQPDRGAEHPQSGPRSRGMIESRFTDLIRRRNEGILVTQRRDGRPQLSNVNYAFDPGSLVIRISTTNDRAKVSNLRRN